MKCQIYLLYCRKYTKIQGDWNVIVNFSLSPVHSTCKFPDSSLFTMTVRNKFAWGKLESLKYSVKTYCGYYYKQTWINNALETMKFWVQRGQMVTFTQQRQGGSDFHNGQWRKDSHQNNLIYRDVENWLGDHDLEIMNRQLPLTFLLDLHKEGREHKFNFKNQNKVSQSSVISKIQITLLFLNT